MDFSLVNLFIQGVTLAGIPVFVATVTPGMTDIQRVLNYLKVSGCLTSISP